MPDKQSGDATVPALVRAFSIIDILAMSSVGLTKTEIARRLEIPYSSTFNILSTMESHGYVRKDEPTGRYWLGLKLISLGNIPLRDSHVRDCAAPYLEEVVKKTALTAHVATLDRGEAVYIDRREPDAFVRINIWVGKRCYAHCSAVGKALICDMSEEDMRDLIGGRLPHRTAKSITSLAQLSEELTRVRRMGYAVDDEEDEEGGRGIAAPILDSMQRVVASFGVAGTVGQIPVARCAVVGPMLAMYAAEISLKLGCPSEAVEQRFHRTRMRQRMRLKSR